MTVHALVQRELVVSPTICLFKDSYYLPHLLPVIIDLVNMSSDKDMDKMSGGSHNLSNGGSIGALQKSLNSENMERKKKRLNKIKSGHLSSSFR